jgi:hypothetical protein
MKIKGKEIKNYSNENTGLVTGKTLLDIEKDLKESLDDFVLILQDWAYNSSKRWESLVDENEKEKAYIRARAYLDAVGEINRKFGTKYSQSIENVIKHFENKIPARDD